MHKQLKSFASGWHSPSMMSGMKNKLTLLLTLLTLSGFMATAARAGGGPPPGPHPHHFHHGFGGPGFFPGVNFVIGTGDSQPNPGVSMVGHVYRQVGDDTYLFTDGSTTYQLDSDDSHLPIGARIVIGGQFNGDGEINVHHWHYVE